MVLLSDDITDDLLVKRFFEAGSKTGIQAAHAAKLSRQLSRLNQVKTPGDMNIPGWKLHIPFSPELGSL